MPDLTKAQMLAVVQGVLAVIVALGWVDQAGVQQMLLAASAVLGVGLAGSDSHLRGKRAGVYRELAANGQLVPAPEPAASTPAPVPPPGPSAGVR